MIVHHIVYFSHLMPIKSLDPARKCLNRRHVSDYPLVLHCLVFVGNRLAHKLATKLSTVFNIEILTEPVGISTRVQYTVESGY